MNPLALVLLLLIGSGPVLELSPPACDFGILRQDAGAVERTLEAANRSDRRLQVSLVSTCDCLSVSPASFSLAPGASIAVQVRFDPADDSGPFEKDLIVRTDHPELPKALYLVLGEVRREPQREDQSEAAELREPAGEAGAAPPAEEPASKASRRAGAIPVDFYYSPGCRSCLEILRRTLPKLERRLGATVDVREHNILDPQQYARYLEHLQTLGAEERAFPALVVGTTVLQGEKEIERELYRLLEEAASGASGSPAASTVPAAARSGGSGDLESGQRPESRLDSRLAFLPVLAAGLIDGINPCAFTTLIFLISALAVAGRSRREVLWIGLFFTLAVFATYLGVGLGFFQAIRMAAAFPLVAILIRWVLVAVLAVFAALSLYDYFLIRAGRTDRVVLQLPRGIKRRLHRDIKQRTRSAALIATALALGFLVSIFELACTGQVYFPTIVYVLRVGGDAGALPYLLLYNLGFVVPLLAVFALGYWGVSSQRITALFQRSAGYVKLALAALFVGLAVLTVLS